MPSPTIDHAELFEERPFLTLTGNYPRSTPGDFSTYFGTIVQQSWNGGAEYVDNFGIGAFYPDDPNVTPDDPGYWTEWLSDWELVLGTTNTFRLVNELNTEYLGATGGSATLTAPPIPAPGGLSASVDATGQVTLAWSYNEDRITGFAIDRRRGADGPFRRIAFAPAWATSIYDPDRLPLDGTTYTYRVRAFDRTTGSYWDHGPYDGWSSADTRPLTTPQTAVPAAPRSLRAEAYGGGGVDLAWDDYSDDETGFRITRTKVSDGSTRTFEVAADVAYFYDGSNDLTPGASYRYSVVAYNDAGVSSAITSSVTPSPLQSVTIQAIDPTAGEAGPNPGRWVIWRSGTAVDRPLTVNVLTTPSSADGHYSLAPGVPVVIPRHYFGAVLQLDPNRNDGLDPSGRVDGSVAPGADYAAGAGVATILMAADEPSVTTVEFLADGGKQSSPEAEARRGDLDANNPDNPNFDVMKPDNPTLPFKGGWRVFPDAKDFDTRDKSRNLVRVRAEINMAQPDVDVYFRSFDVDDPATHANPAGYSMYDEYDKIDPDDNGGDNRGTLTGAALDSPGESHDPRKADGSARDDGYSGRLRAVGATAFAAEDAWVLAKTEVVGGKAYAEVELAVSFAPGDNFRVVASTRAPEDEGLTEKGGKAVSTAGMVRNLPHGSASPQLSVWRRLHIEQDKMRNTEADGTTTIGDFAAGTITNLNLDPVTKTAVVSGPDIGFQTSDGYNGGHLKVGNTFYPIIDSETTSATISTAGLAPLPQPPFAVTAYQDDFDEHGHLRVNVNDDTALYALLQENTAHTKNKFAEAYIQPALTTLDRFDDDVAGETHRGRNSPGFSTDRDTAAAGSETNVFWVAYLSTAFEAGYEEDIDGSNEGPLIGFTSPDQQAALVYVETTRDFSEPVVGGPKRYAFAQELAVTAAHEIGHQFGLAAGQNGLHREDPVNLMAVVSLQESAGNPNFKYEYIRLHPIDIAAIRKRVNSPGAQA